MKISKSRFQQIIQEEIQEGIMDSFKGLFGKKKASTVGEAFPIDKQPLRKWDGKWPTYKQIDDQIDFNEGHMNDYIVDISREAEEEAPQFHNSVDGLINVVRQDKILSELLGLYKLLGIKDQLARGDASLQQMINQWIKENEDEDAGIATFQAYSIQSFRLDDLRSYKKDEDEDDVELPDKRTFSLNIANEQYWRDLIDSLPESMFVQSSQTSFQNLQDKAAKSKAEKEKRKAAVNQIGGDVAGSGFNLDAFQKNNYLNENIKISKSRFQQIIQEEIQKALFKNTGENVGDAPKKPRKKDPEYDKLKYRFGYRTENN